MRRWFLNKCFTVNTEYAVVEFDKSDIYALDAGWCVVLKQMIILDS